MKSKIFEIYLKTFISFLKVFGLARWTKKINQAKINGRDKVLIEEARRRRLEIENLVVFGKPTRFYRVKKNGRSYFYETMPLGSSYNRLPHEVIDNKWFIKKILQKNGLPTPEGRIVSNLGEVQNYLKVKGLPIVIKPLRESRCLGVTVDIRNKKELLGAIKDVQKYGKKFLVEEFLKGQSYRVTVVNDKVTAACLRRPPQVIGDGIHTVLELIKIKNNHPKRSGLTLCPIKIDRASRQLLRKQKINLKTVIAKNQLVILNKKINLGSGADTIDVTGKIHPKIVKLCLRVAKIFDAKVLGLDVLVPDISKAPTLKNPLSIIEINSLPFIDMHHYPWKGKPRNVAGAIWQMVLR